ncbi:MAG: substrate-binding domain-containing protein [Anaerolineales bacterium]
MLNSAGPRRPPILRRIHVDWRGLSARGSFLLFALALGIFTAWPWLTPSAMAPPRTLIVYGFSILAEALEDGVFPAFRDEWQSRTGQQVEFVSSFSGSGTITNQVVLGVPAEVAILSLELDAFRLEDAGVLAGPTWRDLPHGGVLNRTPFIILVRPGNPDHVTDFGDLTPPGIGIVHPDPLTSGGAQWAVLAEYGSVLFLGGDTTQAEDQLSGIWRNVVAQASSARGARTQFEGGFGDVLITYEQEAVYDLGRGRLDAEIVYPRSTILSEHIVVVPEKNIPLQDLPLVRAFTDFLWTERAQQIFVEYGFRSVNAELNSGHAEFGVIEVPFTVADLGGWKTARADIIQAIWKDRVLTALRP